VLDDSRLRRSCGSWAFSHVVIVPHSLSVAFPHVRSRVLSYRPAVVIGIFLAVERCHMRRISVEIRPPDPKLLPMFIDSFPEDFRGSPSLIPCPALDAYDIGRKPVAVATAEAPAMV